MGKSALALNIAQHAALGCGLTVAFFSIEMRDVALGLRLLASEAGIDASLLKRGWIPDREWGPLSQAIGRLAETGIFIDESADLTVFDVRAKARRLQADRGVDLVIVDYLQMMRPVEAGENRNLEMAQISRALKVIRRICRFP
jgi:replicative DNA helicase